MSGFHLGDNLSLFLFSLFLNGLIHFKSNSYLVRKCYILNNENIGVVISYLLLYADHTVIFSKSPEELQIALDTMQSYCDTWTLQVNTSKTKEVVF